MENKRIIFKKYTRPEWHPTTHKKVQGTGCYSENFTERGYFLHWGITFEELSQGIAQYTVAIIMDLEGNVLESDLDAIKFVINKQNEIHSNKQ